MGNLSFQILFIIFLSQTLYFNTIKPAFCHDALNVTCKPIERKALLEFKSGLLDPSERLSSWIGEDCCRWRGVCCSTKTNHVIKLDLHGFRDHSSVLEGMISSSLLDLKYLNYLDLSLNYFGINQIPNFFGSLKNLKYLNLSYIDFSGPIPQNLGNLSKLEYLDLYDSYRQGVNDIRWMSSLSSLKYLNLGAIDLSGVASHWFQSINALPSLLELHLPYCTLTNLPVSFPSINFTSLSVLDLSFNEFNSTIPQWLFNLSSLTELNLNSNHLRGVIPDALYNLSALEILDLSYNVIEGKLSRRLGNLCNLKELILTTNRFTGSIIGFIDSLSRCQNNSLERLELRSNKLTGNIPENLGHLSSLVALGLSKNLLEGIITEAHLMNLSSLQELSISSTSDEKTSLAFNISSNWVSPFKLRDLYITACQLGPKFPRWLKNQTELNSLILRDVKISDTIPDWFIKLNLKLDKLDLSENQLRGPVPNSFEFYNDLAYVDLGSNLFEGPLPLWHSNVVVLRLNDNLFSGPIPQDIDVRMPNLIYLDISRNCLNDSMPMSLGNLERLQYLSISSNKLSGSIPQIWGNKYLDDVDMSNNRLTGFIITPSFLEYECTIFSLTLSGNNLYGKIPSILRNCTSMEFLDLGDNQLSGNIPAWIGESMPYLQMLRLRNNSFTGNIPLQLCGLSKLHILDLSKNRLLGAIPSCIGNLVGFRIPPETYSRYSFPMLLDAKGSILSYWSIVLELFNIIDLSDNGFNGEIPANITSLFKLQTLNLSINQLTGNIPSDIGSLKMLETLDLSVNHLRGHIPTSMVSLNFLSHLNLSYNNLSGNIPTGNQFQSLNDPSIYMGNLALCGSPLQTKCTNDTSYVGGNESMDDDDDDDKLQKLIFFTVAVAGFFLGFWGVCGTLIVNKNLRDAYFDFLKRIEDKVC